MCSGALREYLIEQSALPSAPLIAAVPISLRDKDTQIDNEQAGGNSVSMLLCNLGTDRADPADRLEVIARSMREGKQMMRGLSRMHAMAVGALNLSPMAFSQIPGVTRFAPPSSNILISNVPGPTEDLYFNGARLDGAYPLAIVLRRVRVEHHPDESGGLPRLRADRLSAQRPASAAHAHPPRRFAGRAGEGGVLTADTHSVG